MRLVRSFWARPGEPEVGFKAEAEVVVVELKFTSAYSSKTE